MALPEGETTQLRGYTLAKQQVTACVRDLKMLLESRRAPAEAPGTSGASGEASIARAAAAEQAQALLVKLAADRFNLAVVGQFKRGKSSLMNAVIGRDLLPTGLLPLTSAITTISYWPREQAFLRRKGWSIEQEVSLSELADYITERGNPGNEKGLVEARVELPERFLRRGLYFIDTPGVGSIQQENTATTYAFLPQADAVIFVTSVDGPFSSDEQRFLRDIGDHLDHVGQARKLFVVANKIDLLNEWERAEVLGYIRAGIDATLGSGDVRLFAVSARQALQTKLSGDSAGLQQSGLPEMEASLTDFLAREQGRAFLVSVLDRALDLLPEMEVDNGDSLVTQEISADGLRERMASLRTALLSDAGLTPVIAGEPGESGSTTSAKSANGEVIERAVAATVKASLSEQRRGSRNLRGGTCPICFAQGQAVFDFFARWQYTLSTSDVAQRASMSSRGFCPVHTWQFQQMASPLGISEGYAPLIEASAAELRRLAGIAGEAPERIGAHIDALLPGIETCAACRVLRETETGQIDRVLTQISTPSGREAYSRSEGLCLPHLRAALMAAAALPILAASPEGQAGEFLLREQIRILEEISEDMRSYTLKRDALRRQLTNSQEENAWKRALVQLVGERTARITAER